MTFEVPSSGKAEGFEARRSPAGRSVRRSPFPSATSWPRWNPRAHAAYKLCVLLKILGWSSFPGVSGAPEAKIKAI